MIAQHTDEEHLKYFTREDPSLATLSSVEAFIDSYYAGELHLDWLSEEAPEDNTGPVYTVVANNFDEMTKKSGKDVLMVTTAPWCDACTEVIEMFSEVALEFEDVK